MKIRFKRLSAKLLAIHLPMALMAVVGAFAYLEFQYYSGKRASLVDSLHRAVDVQKVAFVSALWEFDLVKVRALLAEQAQLPWFHSAAVYGADGKLLAVLSRTGDPHLPPEAPDLRVEKELVHASGGKREVIGRLVMTAHGENIRDDLMRHVQANAIVLLVLTVALVGGTIVGTQVVVGRPLEVFLRAIESAKAGGEPKPVKWDSGDEIGNVVRAYNAMQAAQAVAEAEARQRTEVVEKAQAELAGYQKRLEQLVEERTADLSTSRHRVQRILELANEGFWLIDNDLLTTEVNPAMCQILGRGRDEVVGRHIFDFVDEANREILRHQARLREEGQAGAYEVVLRRADGTNVPCLFNVTPIRDDAGAKVGAFAMVTDIAERKQAEIRLRQHMDELEKFSKVAVGRELRMIQLKEEINTLRKQLGQVPHYEVVA